MVNSILNALFLRRFRCNLASNRFLRIIDSELAEEYLKVLLKLMALMFYIDENFRRNIKNFNARYMFMDKNKDISVSVIFENSKLKVMKKQIQNANVTIIFKDEKALMDFLSSPKPDVFSAILNQDVTYKGNLNYISKFGYMVVHLRLMFT